MQDQEGHQVVLVQEGQGPQEFQNQTRSIVISGGLSNTTNTITTSSGISNSQIIKYEIVQQDDGGNHSRIE